MALRKLRQQLFSVVPQQLLQLPEPPPHRRVVLHERRGDHYEQQRLQDALHPEGVAEAQHAHPAEEDRYGYSVAAHHGKQRVQVPQEALAHVERPHQRPPQLLRHAGREPLRQRLDGDVLAALERRVELREDLHVVHELLLPHALHVALEPVLRLRHCVGLLRLHHVADHLLDPLPAEGQPPARLDHVPEVPLVLLQRGRPQVHGEEPEQEARHRQRLAVEDEARQDERDKHPDVLLRRHLPRGHAQVAVAEPEGRVQLVGAGHDGAQRVGLCVGLLPCLDRVVHQRAELGLEVDGRLRDQLQRHGRVVVILH
ncbi:nucleotide-binding universal stress protein, UspA family [Babesia caballi]|uniref:Nucleotide-binding universal stress protein, UspA family n=1 Tax=Babesia caballi TaxID=5871 RepID=A0AAV4LTB1_BABCB|nr:nucleotide-binding universal stress protein, UspA family [Babesia caballi]